MNNENIIDSFIDQYEFLRLDYNCDFEMDGIMFHSASAAYYCQKNPDKNSWVKFARLNPNKAREKAKKLPNTEEYEENKIDYLYKANKAKFDYNLILQTQLVNTKDKELINNVSYRDEFLGVYQGKGANILGKILMKLRSHYIKEREKHLADRKKVKK